MKLYRYRPLCELLFKELLYSELYLASPTELNDPLDLNGRLNFLSKSEDEIKALVRFLSRRLIIRHLYHDNYDLVKSSMDLFSYENLGMYIATKFRNCNRDIVTKADLFEIVSGFCNKNFSIKTGMKEHMLAELFTDLDKLFSQILDNSSVACFSKNHTNFLMWSHYASGHAGVCLEFEVDEGPENSDMCCFPVTVPSARFNNGNIMGRVDVKAIKYPTSLSSLSFYDHLPVFNNTGDVDLMNLSKSYWHPYAERIESMFLEKLEPWHEEEEWRLIRVSFQEELPESRIFRFDDNALTGIYFGAKASETSQNRIRNIIDMTNSDPMFYKCNVDGTTGIHVEKAPDIRS